MEYLAGGRKLTGATAIEQISAVYGKQAVVVSIDPRRVYVKDPKDVKHATVKVGASSRVANEGVQMAWCSVHIKKFVCVCVCVSKTPNAIVRMAFLCPPHKYAKYQYSLS